VGQLRSLSILPHHDLDVGALGAVLAARLSAGQTSVDDRLVVGDEACAVESRPVRGQELLHLGLLAGLDLVATDIDERFAAGHARHI
jgi:hypothetical protein